jgi:hypothetical protein
MTCVKNPSAPRLLITRKMTASRASGPALSAPE